MRRAALAPAAFTLAALALSGCQTTAEESARLELQARLAAAHEHVAQQALSFTRTSAYVKVVSATLLQGSEGAAAAVTVRNSSRHELRALPIALTVKDPSGRQLYKNEVAGTQAALVSISSIPAHGELTWVDDQLPSRGAGASLGARVGEGAIVRSGVPTVAVAGLHTIEDPANGPGAAGTVSNRSPVAQHNLVVFVLALRGARPVAAARAVLPEVAPAATLPFQAFFIGDPRGARLQASAPPSSFG